MSAFNASDDDQFLPIKISTFVTSVLMSLCCLCGIYGNVVSVCIFSHPLSRSPINILLSALSAIDLILVLLVVPVFILPGLNTLLDNDHVRGLYPVTLVTAYPLNTMAQSISVWTFVLISFERYVAVCQPLNRHKLLTCRQARLAQSIIVLLALSYNMIRFWEYEIDWHSRVGYRRLLRQNRIYYLYYFTVLYLLVHFLAPFLTILVLNGLILRSLRHSRLKWRQFSRKQRQQRRTSTMIVVITLTFTFCNTPPFLINIWEALEPNLFAGPAMTYAYILVDVTNLLVIFNSSFTVCIYWLYCNKYRRMFRYFSAFACLRSNVLSRADAVRIRSALLNARFTSAAPLIVFGNINDALWHNKQHDERRSSHRVTFVSESVIR